MRPSQETEKPQQQQNRGNTRGVGRLRGLVWLFATTCALSHNSHSADAATKWLWQAAEYTKPRPVIEGAIRIVPRERGFGSGFYYKMKTEETKG